MTHTEISNAFEASFTDLGFEAGYETANTDFGRSDYFVLRNGEKSLKLRVSDHSVENVVRMEDEMHYKIQGASTQTIQARCKAIEFFFFPERFNMIECNPKIGAFNVGGKFYEAIKIS